MPSAGRFDFPVIDVDDAIERLRKIRTVAGGRIASREVAAGAMGMAEKGGHTMAVLAALHDYGLADTGDNNLTVTSIGELALFGNPEEIRQAKIDAIRHVDLFKHLFDTYGANPTDEQLRAFLRQTAVVEIARIPPLIEQIGKLLKKMSPYLMDAQRPLAGGKPPEGAGRGETKQMSDRTDAFIELRIGASYARFPQDDLNLADTLVTAIQSMVDKLRQTSKAPTSGNAEQGKDE